MTNEIFAAIASIVGNVFSVIPILMRLMARYQQGSIERERMPKRFMHWILVSTVCWSTIFLLPLLTVGHFVFGLSFLHMGEVILAFGAVVNLIVGLLLGALGYVFLTLRLNR